MITNPLTPAAEQTPLSRKEYFPSADAKTRTQSLHLGLIVSPLLLLGDLVCFFIAFCGAMALLPDNTQRTWFLLSAPVCGIVILHLTGGHDRRTDFLSLGYVSEFLIAIGVATMASMFFAYIFWTFDMTVKPSRAFIPLLFAFFAIPSLYFRRWVGMRLNAHYSNRTLLVIGVGADVRSFYRKYVRSGLHWTIEFVEPSGVATEATIDGPGSPQVSGDLEAKLARSHDWYSAILLACQTMHLPLAPLQQLIRMHCSNVPVLSLDAFSERQWRRVRADAAGPEWLFDREFPLASGSIYSNLKRAIDVAVSAAALTVLCPFLLAIAAIIRLDSCGPVIFRQERVGREGRVFVMFKFRTMRANESAVDGDLYTREGDERVTRFGRLLRKMRLDELPQLWNVFIGDMSLIGPRAEWVKCVEIYERLIPNYHLRHLVKPGITGWAQVRYKYSENTQDAVDKFEYDLYYIRHFSPELDVSIVLKTLHTMLGGEGR